MIFKNLGVVMITCKSDIFHEWGMIFHNLDNPWTEILWLSILILKGPNKKPESFIHLSDFNTY